MTSLTAHKVNHSDPHPPSPNRDFQPTGIRELDQMLNGGIPFGTAILLSGGSGTGKTILATQWLFEGYKQFKEPGVYISLTEPVAKAIHNAKKLAFFDAAHVGPLQVFLPICAEL